MTADCITKHKGRGVLADSPLTNNQTHKIMKKIFLFIVGWSGYVTADDASFQGEPDGAYNSVDDAIDAVDAEGLLLQLDRRLLDENKHAGGYSFAGDDYDTFTVEI